MKLDSNVECSIDLLKKWKAICEKHYNGYNCGLCPLSSMKDIYDRERNPCYDLLKERKPTDIDENELHKFLTMIDRMED